MTVTVPDAPGAVIDIKLSEQVMPHAGSLLTQKLGNSLDKLFAHSVQDVEAARNAGTLTAGSGFNVNIGNGVMVRVNGTKIESPEIDASGQREGHIDASSFTLTGANGSTSTISGDISYAYARLIATDIQCIKTAEIRSDQRRSSGHAFESGDRPG
ncbi:MAG: hypothetical protein EBV64_13080 [Oxalobacteraceae bacterium]|nr:hypothetical protein [Oxalobacteraceae bacterium]